MNSMQPSTGAMSIYTGFTKLCRGLAVVLVGGHIVVQTLPSTVSYLALIPCQARKGSCRWCGGSLSEISFCEELDRLWTIPFAWNLITAEYLEQAIAGVIISTISLLFIGKLFEPIWGSREFLKFIFVVNFLTSICVFITAIFFYYITSYLPISGFQGVLSGFLVGIKQIIPDQELSLLKIKLKWLPSLALLMSTIICFFAAEMASYLPSVIFGTYIGWIYLRYWQRKSETKLRGDPSDDFAFSTFFPPLLRPVIDPVATIFEKMLCGRRSVTSDEMRGYTVGGTSLPGSDPIEASRRRERGARALEERLAERLAAARRTDETDRDALDNV